jgi:hypothetical protein
MSTKRNACISLVVVALLGIVSSGVAFKANTNIRSAVIYCSTTSTTAATLTIISYTINPVPVGIINYCTSIYHGSAQVQTYITPQE